MQRPSALAAAALAAGAVAAAPAASTAHPGHRPPPPRHGQYGGVLTYALPGAAIVPEGVAVDRASGRYFVSATSDGSILRGRLDRPAAAPFLAGGADGRITATGLEVDRHRGRLFVAGAATGLAFAYDARSGRLIRRFETGAGGFLNDVAVAHGGTAYVSDSTRPALWRLPAKDLAEGGGATTALRPFLDLTGLIPYQAGFNLNGLVTAPDGRRLIAVQSNTGRLWRIDPRARTAGEIDLGGARLTNGDGLEIDGRTLDVVRNRDGVVATVRLAKDLASGRLTGAITDPSLHFPTSAALAGGRLLVVNSQFDRRSSGLPPDLPFTLSSLPRG